MKRREFVRVSGAAILALGAGGAFLEACLKPGPVLLEAASERVAFAYGGRVFYLSSVVKDNLEKTMVRDGLSLQTAFRSFDELSEVDLKESDTIMIEPGEYKKQVMEDGGGASVKFSKDCTEKNTSIKDCTFIRSGQWDWGSE